MTEQTRLLPAVGVRYYAGGGNRVYPAQLFCDNGRQLRLVYDGGKTAVYALADAQYIAQVGGIPAALEFPDDARIEFLDGIPEWLPLKNKAVLAQVGRFEQGWKWAAAALVLILAVLFAAFRWGVPAAAYHTAHHLPQNTLQRIGEQTEAAMLEITGESGLSRSRRQEISALYRRLNPEPPAKLLFRKGGNIGANAFAIPNNTIVLTDELVALAGSDNEILAVLAHEQGHLHHRHSLQQMLRGLGIGVVMLSLTGDGSSLLDNLPIMLATAQYSQAFELEADLYAIRSLQRLGMKPQYLADFLQRLHDQHEHGAEGLNILSSHPLTSERVKQVEQYAR